MPRNDLRGPRNKKRRFQSAARANRDEGKEEAELARQGVGYVLKPVDPKVDPTKCGYVSSGAEAIEAIKADSREMMGTLARGMAALDRDEGTPG